MPRDIDVTITPVWMLTTDGHHPNHAHADHQHLYLDHTHAENAKNTAGPHARLWKAHITSVTELSQWEET